MQEGKLGVTRAERGAVVYGRQFKLERQPPIVYDQNVRSDNPIKAAIFDGDDTLWSTEVLYDNARDAARQIVAESGVDPHQWELRQRVIDVANVPIYGFSSERFPASCLQAFEELEPASGADVDDAARARLVYAAQSVFRNNPELIPHVESVLQTLRNRGVRLALLTKGDPIVQKKRIEKSGLASFFDVIEIVPDKTPAVFIEVLEKLGALPNNAWTVGNSLHSDILPALTAGANGIWIDAPVWEYEQADTSAPEAFVPKVSDIRAVLEIIR